MLLINLRRLTSSLINDNEIQRGKAATCSIKEAPARSRVCGTCTQGRRAAWLTLSLARGGHSTQGAALQPARTCWKGRAWACLRSRCCCCCCRSFIWISCCCEVMAWREGGCIMAPERRCSMLDSACLVLVGTKEPAGSSLEPPRRQPEEGLSQKVRQPPPHHTPRRRRQPPPHHTQRLHRLASAHEHNGN